MSSHSPEYKRYLHSDLWAIKRAMALHREGNRCSQCGVGGSLDVHHLTYERLGAELPEDLVVLCRGCHEEADEHREVARSFPDWLEYWYPGRVNTDAMFEEWRKEAKSYGYLT